MSECVHDWKIHTSEDNHAFYVCDCCDSVISPEVLQTIKMLEGKIQELEAVMPDLHAVINWLVSGCNPKDAAEELKIYQARMDKLASEI